MHGDTAITSLGSMKEYCLYPLLEIYILCHVLSFTMQPFCTNESKYNFLALYWHMLSRRNAHVFHKAQVSQLPGVLQTQCFKYLFSKSIVAPAYSSALANAVVILSLEENCSLRECSSEHSTARNLLLLFFLSCLDLFVPVKNRLRSNDCACKILPLCTSHKQLQI